MSEDLGVNGLDQEKDQPTLHFFVLCKECRNVMEKLCCHALRLHCML